MHPLAHTWPQICTKSFAYKMSFNPHNECKKWVYILHKETRLREFSDLGSQDLSLALIVTQALALSSTQRCNVEQIVSNSCFNVSKFTRMCQKPCLKRH